MKNTHNFYFVSTGAGRMFLRINLFIDSTLPTFQRRITVVSVLWITVQITLIQRCKWNKVRNRIINVAQHRYNVSAQRQNNVTSTLHKDNATISQHCTMSFQLCFNVDMTLSQHCFNVASTSVKAVSKPIWLVKSMDL